jgi:hypothetical protein
MVLHLDKITHILSDAQMENTRVNLCGCAITYFIDFTHCATRSGPHSTDLRDCGVDACKDVFDLERAPSLISVRANALDPCNSTLARQAIGARAFTTCPTPGNPGLGAPLIDRAHERPIGQHRPAQTERINSLIELVNFAIGTNRCIDFTASNAPQAGLAGLNVVGIARG